MTETPWGTATIADTYVTVTAHGAQLYAWANRTNERWPCSVLAGGDSATAVFTREGLLDLVTEGIDEDVPADELTAWATDVLEAAGGFDEGHEVWFVLVGQHLSRTRPGVEGPFRYPSGWEGYYDPAEGRYLGLDDVYMPRCFTP